MNHDYIRQKLLNMAVGDQSARYALASYLNIKGGGLAELTQDENRRLDQWITDYGRREGKRRHSGKKAGLKSAATLK